jgi:hypothetical protein
MILIKNCSQSGNWYVYHRGLDDPAKEYLNLDLNGAVNGNAVIWGATNPSDSVFTIGSSSYVNGLNDEYVAYLFAHDDHEDGYIQCGSYVGNGSTTGPIIDLGFEPQWLMIKRSSDVSGWYIMDNMRGLPVDGPANNTATPSLQAQEPNSEGTSTSSDVDINATGFQCTTDSNGSNANGSTYIYMAIRRPNKPAEEFEPDELFAMDENINGVINPAYRTSPEWPVDFSLFRAQPLASANINAASRLMAPNFLKTNLNEVEEALTGGYWDYMNGWRSTSPAGQLAWMWRRAPGFFDVVTYEGDGSGDLELKNSLGVKPEMLWLKPRTSGDSYSGNWHVWHESFGYAQSSANLNLNSDASLSSARGVNPVHSFAPDGISPNIRGGASGEHNKAGVDYIAMLWASVPGICDIGTYTGNGVGPWSSPGDSLKVDCGFTNGARFVLVKRTDAQGNWIFFDTIRGSQSTLSLNTTNAEVLAQYGTDAPWPLYPKGFAVVDYNFDSDLHNPNIKDVEYIYMAIA